MGDYIEGLRFEPNVPHNQAKGCRFPESKPFYIVYHGSEAFAYPHYGVHLGQEDNLTFLGDEGKEIVGLFLDCRKGSPTWGVRLQIAIQPDVTCRLVVPPGVGHSFIGLENVYTLNTYRLFLPRLDALISGGHDWQVENDVLNVSLDADDVPAYEANTEPAANLFYEMVAQHHRVHLTGRDTQYPVVQDVIVADGRTVRMRFTAAIENAAGKDGSLVPNAFSGLVKEHIRVRSSATSGIMIVPHFGEIVVSRAELASRLMRASVTILPLGGRLKTPVQLFRNGMVERGDISPFQELTVPPKAELEPSEGAFLVARTV